MTPYVISTIQFYLPYVIAKHILVPTQEKKQQVFICEKIFIIKLFRYMYESANGLRPYAHIFVEPTHLRIR